MPTSELKERGEEISPGNIFFLGWEGLPRGTNAVECLKCGGYAPEVAAI